MFFLNAAENVCRTIWKWSQTNRIMKYSTIRKNIFPVSQRMNHWIDFKSKFIFLRFCIYEDVPSFLSHNISLIWSYQDKKKNGQKNQSLFLVSNVSKSKFESVDSTIGKCVCAPTPFRKDFGILF